MTSVPREGVRKSAREHYKPLEWWRGEKLVYGRTRGQSATNGLVLVPPIREIVRIPKEEPMPLGAKRKRGARGRSKSKAADDAEVKYVEMPETNPEEGWDDETDPQCVVLDFPSREEVMRRMQFLFVVFASQFGPDSLCRCSIYCKDGETTAYGEQ